MGILSSLKASLTSQDESWTYRYHCDECDARFETEERRTSVITCPECGNGEKQSLYQL